MDYRNFFKWLEEFYRIPLTKELQNTLTEHFGENLNIYTEQDLYEQSRKIMQIHKEKCINKIVRKYYKYL